eukprot:g10753.t1
MQGWGDAELCEGQRLWSIDKEGCCVWMCALGGLAHDVLKHFLDSTKGQFEAVVAFSPTGWSWSKGMAQGSGVGMGAADQAAEQEHWLPLLGGKRRPHAGVQCSVQRAQLLRRAPGLGAAAAAEAADPHRELRDSELQLIFEAGGRCLLRGCLVLERFLREEPAEVGSVERCEPAELARKAGSEADRPGFRLGGFDDHRWHQLAKWIACHVFDTPFALLPKDLNNPKEKKGDLNPIAKRSEELYQDENKLWKKKREVFDKQQTWGRETAIWSNPEETRDKDKRKYKPGEVFWGAKGTFGGKSEDSGLLTLQRGEVDQTMELNEKGLWVRKKKPTEEAPGLSASAKQLLKASSSVEDPRLEAAKPKGRGTADASEKALQALQERRQLERKVADEMGMTNKGMKPQHRSGPVTTLNNSSQQCRPSKRHAGMKRWQGVQRSDEEAKEIVEKALGSCAVGGEAPKRMEPSQTSNKRNRSPSPVLGLSSPSGSEKEDDGKFEAAWMDSDDEREASKLNQKPSGGDIVVDFF